MPEGKMFRTGQTWLFEKHLQKREGSPNVILLLLSI